MSSRIFSPVLVLLLVAGCGSGPGSDPSASSDAESAENRIECALDGAAEFSRACQVETRPAAGKTAVIVRHPDGGFQRFTLDGAVISTSDGADDATAMSTNGVTEVSVGRNRYRFPAPAQSDAPRP